MTRDSIGQQIDEGDVVVVPFNGSFIDAVVLKLDSGLASNVTLDGGKVAPAQPSAVLQLLLKRPVVTPDGRIVDAVRIGRLNKAGVLERQPEAASPVAAAPAGAEAPATIAQAT